MTRPDPIPPPTLASAPPSALAARSLELPRGRCLSLADPPRLMGILNLTPDSFSDGGLWSDPDRAVARGLEILAEGADLLDLGAESTRPGGGVYGAGAAEVTADEELARLLPVLTRLRRETDAPLSVDTRKGAVARRALAEGADLINDVSGGRDPDLLAAVAAAGCPLILMHSRGELATMQRGIAFDDLVGEVAAELAAAVERAQAAGIRRGQLAIDPGIGFGKTWEQNLELIGRLDALGELGLPILLGASRKSFLARAFAAAGPAALTAPAAPTDRKVVELPPAARLPGSLAAAAWALAHGAALLRVHDVAATVQFIAIWKAIRGRRGEVAWMA